MYFTDKKKTSKLAQRKEQKGNLIYCQYIYIYMYVYVLLTELDPYHRKLKKRESGICEKCVSYRWRTWSCSYVCTEYVFCEYYVWLILIIICTFKYKYLKKNHQPKTGWYGLFLQKKTKLSKKALLLLFFSKKNYSQNTTFPIPTLCSAFLRFPYVYPFHWECCLFVFTFRVCQSFIPFHT